MNAHANLIRTIVLLASLFLCAKSAIANVLTLADYVNFYNFDLRRMQPLGNDLVALVIHPPMPHGNEAAAHTQDCLIQLFGNRPIGSLSRPRRPLSRGSSPAGCPAEPLVSYRINRQFSGWNLPPPMIRAFGAIWANCSATDRIVRIQARVSSMPRAFSLSS
jgi:hypothetical protein